MISTSRRVLLVLVCAACAQDRAPHALSVIEAREDLRLDAEAEDFSAVSRVSVGPQGEIAVPLPQDMHIRLYDAKGRRIATVGRRGSGPGEFRHLGSLSWAADTLVVIDARLRRVSYVAADGVYVRSVTLPAPMGAPIDGTGGDTAMAFFNPSAAAADGSLLGTAALMSGGRVTTEQVVVRWTPGQPARVLARPPAYNHERWMMTIGGFENPVPFAFEPQMSVSATADRFTFLTADQSSVSEARFRVTLFGAGGDTLFDGTYQGAVLPVSARERDSAIAALAPRGLPTEGPIDLPARFQAVARERMPSLHPPVRRVILGRGGTVWVELRALTDSVRALALDELGRELGMIVLPPRSRLQQADADHVWATQADDSGLMSIVRYRLIGRHPARATKR
ncbi:MAG: hypothetical protein WEE89_12550 [Gemmatimonadota bacterium]